VPNRVITPAKIRPGTETPSAAPIIPTPFRIAAGLIGWHASATIAPLPAATATAAVITAAAVTETVTALLPTGSPTLAELPLVAAVVRLSEDIVATLLRPCPLHRLPSLPLLVDALPHRLLLLKALPFLRGPFDARPFLTRRLNPLPVTRGTLHLGLLLAPLAVAFYRLPQLRLPPLQLTFNALLLLPAAIYPLYPVYPGIVIHAPILVNPASLIA
jgi:hypothetical protein